MKNKQPSYREIGSLIYPWFVWALSSCFLFYKYLLQVSPSVMVDDLMRTFSLSGLSMGNLAAFYFYAYVCMQLPTGILLDRFSPRRLVAAAVAVCACGALVFSKAQTLGIAELGRLLIGIGGAFSAVGTMKLISLWFPAKRFALVSGLMMSVGMLGAVGGEAPLARLTELFGWRHTMLFGAAAGFILAFVILLLVRDRKLATKKTSAPLQRYHLLKTLKHLARNPQNWLIALYSGLAFAPISAFGGLWGVPYVMEDYHLSRTFTAALVSLIFIGFAIGSPIAGWLSDKMGRRKPMMVIGTILGVLTLSLALYLPPTSDTVLGTLLFIFGFFTSFFFISFATIREVNAPEASGTSIGFINMFNALCGAFSEPLIGKLLDHGWHHKIVHGVRVFSISDYRIALLALPICMLVSLGLMYFIKETFCRQQNTLPANDKAFAQ